MLVFVPWPLVPDLKKYIKYIALKIYTAMLIDQKLDWHQSCEWNTLLQIYVVFFLLLLFIPFYLGILFNASLGCTLYFWLTCFYIVGAKTWTTVDWIFLKNKRKKKKNASGCVISTSMLLFKSELLFDFLKYFFCFEKYGKLCDFFWKSKK